MRTGNRQMVSATVTDHILTEIRFEADDSRQSPGRLTGTLIRYGDVSPAHRERFANGSLSWPQNGIVINEQHNRQAPIVRAIPFLDGDAVKIDVRLPNTQRGRDAAVNVREGVLTGLSVEFRAISQSYVDGIREIREAFLPSAGLVDSPSYKDSLVQVRSKVVTSYDEEEMLLWL